MIRDILIWIKSLSSQREGSILIKNNCYLPIRIGKKNRKLSMLLMQGISGSMEKLMQ